MCCRFLLPGVCALGALVVAPARAGLLDPWADAVVSYDPGETPASGFTDPSAALGEPSRFTDDPSFPSVVSIFSPPFLPEQIVSVGEGGWLVVEFFEPIVDDPGHRFGIDLIVFGNGGFIDTDFPNGRIGDPPGTFGLDDLYLSFSPDGHTWVDYPTVLTEGLFPTQGYLDSGPFDGEPGSVPTDFTRPVDPTLTLEDFAGLSLDEALALYDGSGGGTPVDLGLTGLSEARFVRVFMPDDGDPTTSRNVEIDGFAAVPEPAALLLVLVPLGAAVTRRRLPGALVLAGIAVAVAGRAGAAGQTGLCNGVWEWPVLGHDSVHSGRGPAGPRDVAQPAWVVTTDPSGEPLVPEGPTGPVAAGDLVVLYAQGPTMLPGEASRLVALDRLTGTFLWQTPLPPAESGSWASPAIWPAGGCVVVGSGSEVIGVDADSGAILWQTPLESPVVNASPVIADDLPAARAFVTDFTGFATGGRLYAINLAQFDADTNPFEPGQIVWSTPLGATSGNTPAYANGVVYVASVTGPQGEPAGHLHAIDAADGHVLWRTAVGAGFFGGVAWHDGDVYAASFRFDGGEDNSELVKVRANDGTVVWTVPCERTDSTPVVTGSLILLAGGLNGFGSRPKIEAFRDLGGSAEKLWETDAAGGWTHIPAVAAGRLYAGALPADDALGAYVSLAIFDLTRTPGDPGFVVDTFAGAGNSPALVSGMLITAGPGGVYAFAAPVGLLPGDFDNDGDVDINDFSTLAGCFGIEHLDVWDECAVADLSGDCRVDILDFSTFASHYTGSI